MKTKTLCCKTSPGLFVQFTCIVPGAEKIHLAGSFNDWHETMIPLKRCPGDLWCIRKKIAFGIHEYKYLVDGHWCAHEVLCAEVGRLDVALITNAFGSRNYVIRVESDRLVTQ